MPGTAIIMIEKVEMYMAECDRCGTHWDNGDGICALFDKDAVIDQAQEAEWKRGGEIKGEAPDTIFCPECYFMNDQDEYELHPVETELNAPGVPGSE